MSDDVFEKFFERMNVQSIGTREEDLEQEVSMLEQSNVRLLDMMAEKNKEIAALQGEAEKRRVKLEQATAEIQALRANLPQDLSEIEAELARWKEKATKQATRIEELQSKVDRHKDASYELKTLNELLTKLAKAKRALEEQVVELERDLINERDRRQAAEEVLADTKKRLAEVEAGSSDGKRAREGEQPSARPAKRQTEGWVRLKMFDARQKLLPFPRDTSSLRFDALADVIVSSMRLLESPSEYVPKELEEAIAKRLSGKYITRLAELERKAHARVYEMTRTKETVMEEMMRTVNLIVELDDEDRTYDALMNSISAFRIVTNNKDLLFDRNFTEFYINYMVQSLFVLSFWNSSSVWVSSAGSDRMMRFYHSVKETGDATVEELQKIMESEAVLVDDDDEDEEDEDYEEGDDEDDEDEDEYDPVQTIAGDLDAPEKTETEKGKGKGKRKKEEEIYKEAMAEFDKFLADTSSTTHTVNVTKQLNRKERVVESAKESAFASIPGFSASVVKLTHFWARIVEFMDRDPYLEKQILEDDNEDDLWFYLDNPVDQQFTPNQARKEAIRVENILNALPASTNFAEFAAKNFTKGPPPIDLSQWHSLSRSKKDKIIARWYRFFDTPDYRVRNAIREAIPGERKTISVTEVVTEIVRDIDRQFREMIDTPKDARRSFAEEHLKGAEKDKDVRNGFSFLLRNYANLMPSARDYLFKSWLGDDMEVFDSGTVTKVLKTVFPGKRRATPFKSVKYSQRNSLPLLVSSSPSSTTTSSSSSAASSSSSSSTFMADDPQSSFGKRIGAFETPIRSGQERRTLLLTAKSARVRVENPDFIQDGDRAYFPIQRSVHADTIEVPGAIPVSVSTKPFSRPASAQVTRFARTPGSVDLKASGRVHRFDDDKLCVHTSDNNVWVFDSSDESLAVLYDAPHEIAPHISVSARDAPRVSELSYQFMPSHITAGVSVSLHSNHLTLLADVTNITPDDINNLDGVQLQLSPAARVDPVMYAEAERGALSAKSYARAAPVTVLTAKYLDLKLPNISTLPAKSTTKAAAASFPVVSVDTIAHFADAQDSKYPVMWKLLEFKDLKGAEPYLFDMDCRVDDSLQSAVLFGSHRVAGDRVPIMLSEGKLPVVVFAHTKETSSTTGLQTHIVTLDVSDNTVDEILIGVNGSIQGQPKASSTLYTASRLDTSERFKNAPNDSLVSIRRASALWSDRVQVSYTTRE